MVREAQEREGLWFSLSAPFPIEGGEPPELDQPCLFRIQFQPELREPLPKNCQEPLRIRSVFEAYHQIVSVPDDNHIARCHFLAPSFRLDIGSHLLAHRPQHDGASHQKQVLRFGGALIGGGLFGMGAQVFVLPYIDSIAAFTVLSFP